MAIMKSLSQTLIRSAARLLSSAGPGAVRRFYARSESVSYAPEVEAKAVEMLEDLIHGIIVKRSRPDWLPLVPGASYWVPPRRSSYGVSDAVNKLVNALTDEEYLSLVTVQGWPSSAYYLPEDVCSSTETLHEECSMEESDDEDRSS